MDNGIEADLLGLAGDPVVWMLLAAYFAPTMIAALRKSAALRDCFICNLLFGWSGLGWFAAMFFAVAAPTRAQFAYQQKVQRAKEEFYLREAGKVRS